MWTFVFPGSGHDLANHCTPPETAVPENKIRRQDTINHVDTDKVVPKQKVSLYNSTAQYFMEKNIFISLNC